MSVYASVTVCSVCAFTAAACVTTPAALKSVAFEVKMFPTTFSARISVRACRVAFIASHCGVTVVSIVVKLSNLKQEDGYRRYLDMTCCRWQSCDLPVANYGTVWERDIYVTLSFVR